jgi:aryl-alcohol dehydrogenase-like predicted oxidoreductase
MFMEYRPLATTGFKISAIALGCWPITGITSLDVNEADSLATIESCFDLGINFLDTAYCYGAEGESERMIGRALGRRRDEMVIATKGGLHWENGALVRDASPTRLKQECEESLRRFGTDRVELYYLHAPDHSVPVAESAGALKELMDEGKARAIGVSNFSVAQLDEFAAVCPIAAFQPPYNMLMRDIEADTLPWCREHNVAIMVYWPLMKGLLAGKLPRDHVFAAKDGRAKYPMFQGDEWRKNQDLLDELRPIAAETGRTLSQLVLNWTIHQPGITSALCGAKRAWQNAENAGGAGWRLSETQMTKINAALVRRGKPISRPAV